jgi:hypothetical protein
VGVSYEVFLEPEVHRLRREMPGHVRQRMHRIISSFALEPRPAGTEALDVTGIELPDQVELRRYRLDPWRLMYASTTRRAGSGFSRCAEGRRMTIRTSPCSSND